MILTTTSYMDTREITLASRSENITIVEKLIDELCDKYKIQEEYYGNILIALTEAVNNAIFHGNRQDPDKNVKLKFSASNESLIFIIEDEGPGFDYENLPDPTSPENLEKPNGRGVFLMRNLADAVSFSDNGRIVEIHFNNLNKKVA
jgi:serine/threonine-protein kinase RsbW